MAKTQTITGAVTFITELINLLKWRFCLVPWPVAVSVP